MVYDEKNLSASVDAAILSIVSIADQMSAIDYDDESVQSVLRLAMELRGYTVKVSV